MIPKSHPVSVLTVDDSAELTITFDLSVAVKVMSRLYHWGLGEKEGLDDYVFTSKKSNEVQFHLRFIYTGTVSQSIKHVILFIDIIMHGSIVLCWSLFLSNDRFLLQLVIIISNRPDIIFPLE